MTSRRSFLFTASRMGNGPRNCLPWPGRLGRVRGGGATAMSHLLGSSNSSTTNPRHLRSANSRQFLYGILQTEEYASAVLQVFYDEKSAPEKVAALVDLRTRRRGLLTSENAPRFSFVLDESVIHRLVGSPAVTSRQLLHLVEIANPPDVTIQVVPFTAGMHPAMKEPFEVVQFEDTPDENIVFLEGPRSDIIIENPEETQSYLEAFDHITEISLGPSDSVDLLREAA